MTSCIIGSVAFLYSVKKKQECVLQLSRYRDTDTGTCTVLVPGTDPSGG